MREPKRISRIIITSIALVFIIAVIITIIFAFKAYSGINLALEAAFDDAKILSDNAKGVDVDIDFSLSGSVYDVEFYSQRQKYKYKVDSKGNILFCFRESEEGSSAQISSTSDAKTTEASETVSDITEQHAKQLALSNAGVSESKITEYDADLENFNGIKVYEIEFEYGGYEYNYYINASNGAIVQFDKQRD